MLPRHIITCILVFFSLNLSNSSTGSCYFYYASEGFTLFDCNLFQSATTDLSVEGSKGLIRIIGTYLGLHVIGGHEIQPYLVGDSAYPLSYWFQKPYLEGTRDPSEIQFNKQLSAARVKEECAFGIVKGQWRILSFIKEEVQHDISKIIIACAVLHNFCILHRDEWDLDAGDDGDDGQNPNGNVIGDGEAIREILKDNLQIPDML